MVIIIGVRKLVHIEILYYFIVTLVLFVFIYIINICDKYRILVERHPVECLYKEKKKMIIDKLNNIDMYKCINDKLCIAKDFLMNLNKDTLSSGKYDIYEDDVFAMVFEYETKNEEEGYWEAHRDFIDIQYVLSGMEKIGYCNIEDLNVCKEYDKETDAVLGYANGNFIGMKEGYFMILLPEDAHKPGNIYEEICEVKKIVVKIRL